MSKTYDHNRKPTGHHKLYQLAEEFPHKVPTGIFGQIQYHFLVKSAVSENATEGKTQ
jgi:hypothetical protein